jgi:Flp pilus assembly protein TadD
VAERAEGGYSSTVKRYVVAFVLLAAAGAAGAALVSAYTTDREYARLIALGDQAADDLPFQALEAYSGAIALRPQSMLAHLKRGRLYRERGEFEAAARDLRRALELDATATLPLELLGDTYLSLERFERAEERYQSYLAIDDRSPRVWYKLGLARYRAGQWSEAITPLERAIALDGTAAEAHLLLGLCLRERRDTARARAALETASRLSPALTAPREALAGLYRDEGDSSRAIDQLAALAALDSGNVQRHVALGMAYARARRHEAAVLTLSRAVERFPNDPAVYGALGRVWLESAGEPPDRVALRKAVEALSTAATHPAVSSETLTDLGRAWMLTGNASAAERILRQATATPPLDEEAYRHLAAVTARAGRVQDARDALIRYATLIGHSRLTASVATQIAAYSVRLGDGRTAMAWIERAVEEAGETATLADLRSRAETELRIKNSQP